MQPAAGALKADNFLIHSIDKQPIRFDVSVAVARPVVLEGMVLAPRRQWLVVNQECQDFAQFVRS